jgi:simple sugar transport system ATP-binding protein
LEYVIEIKDGYKFFGRVEALSNINLKIKKNEIIGLIGDNGAGKSTLVKVLTGIYQLNRGELLINGIKINKNEYSVDKARKMGIETVHQESSLVEKQAIWRNIFIGRPITNKLGFINVKKEKEETMNILTKIMKFRGIGISSDSSVSILSGGERQGIAIGRAMYFNAEIIILDEPTTALAIKEVEKVFNFIKKIKKEGKTCIFISHDLYHTFQICNRFVILDKGKIADNIRKEDITFEELSKRLLEITSGRKGQ